ncbi:MAG: DNA repair protein RecN, partial [Candidatus Cloacimonetes bacterium]|nr:DNA repair protein RecN [Candidatus Cloacimonadota bacterium]
QIAAFANKHYAIYKKDTNSKTVVDIRYLDLHKRKNEIARMMSGSNSEIALKYADEILTKLGEQYD